MIIAAGAASSAASRMLSWTSSCVRADGSPASASAASRRRIPSPGALRKTALLQVHRHEQIGVRQQDLGLPEEQEAVRDQAEVQPREHAALRLGVQVHEHVAADQQIDPRDRGRLHEVVPAEDHRAAQSGAERERVAARA